MQNSVLRSRMTIVYWPHPSSVVLFIQNSVFSIRINSLYGTQPSFVAFVCKTATFGSELQVSMVPDLTYGFLHAKQCDYLWVPALICGFCMQNCDFRIRITSLYGSQTSSFFLAFKTATLTPELQVSIGPSPHLWFYAFTTATL